MLFPTLFYIEEDNIMDTTSYFKQLNLVLRKANRRDLIAWGRLLDQKDRYTHYKKKSLGRLHRYMKQLYHGADVIHLEPGDFQFFAEYITCEGNLRHHRMMQITLRDYLILKKLQKGNYRGVMDILRGEPDSVKKEFHSIVMNAMQEKLW